MTAIARKFLHCSVNGKWPFDWHGFQQPANRVDRDARVAIHMWYLVQVQLNPAQVVVVAQLDAAVKLQIIQRAGHTAVRQAGERLELNSGTFQPYDPFRQSQVSEDVAYCSSEICAKPPSRRQWRHDCE